MDSSTCRRPALATRDSIEDIWGPRTPYIHDWPVRVDQAVDEEPEKWVQSACTMCRQVLPSRFIFSSFLSFSFVITFLFFHVHILTRQDSNGCGLDIGVKGNRVVGVRGRASDRVNKGRLGPKGMHR